MNHPSTSAELLAASYAASAKRIREAMSARLLVSNTRSPGQPPNAEPAEVVGVCGQGGRHPYFRLTSNVLDGAVQRILGAGLDIDAIASACQDLRQQTYFDANSGCVNDSLPSMVPLLPPEEVWLDGRELPLDVWRLISFEIDVVSSVASSQLSVQDFAFAAINPSALAFRHLMQAANTRNVSFGLQLKNLPTGWTSAPGAPPDPIVSLARILFEAGQLLTPLATNDLVRSYAVMRYLHWIDDTLSEFRVLDQFDNDSIDSRYRGLFAEEIAVGLMAVVLKDVFGAYRISNTVEVLPQSPTPVRGPIADFIAEAAHPVYGNPTTVVAESKGSLGRPISKTRRDRAKAQVAATNILFSGTGATLPLTLESTIRFSGQPERTHCRVTDPPQFGDAAPTIVDPTLAWRVAYAKALTFVGLEGAARQVIQGVPAQSLRAFDVDRDRERRRTERDVERLRRAAQARERFGMVLVLDVGRCAIGVNQEVFRILQRGITTESGQALTRLFREQAGREVHRPHGGSFEASLGLGCVWYDDLERTDASGRDGA